jgi:NADPH-dependent stearoyl-CoA 9-desaturase
MIGSANIEGSKAMHVMTGNLSHQIEHHCFPDLPSNRYAEIAPRMRDICERYRLSYTTGTLPAQVASAWKQVIRLSLPNGFTVRSGVRSLLGRARRRTAVAAA